MSSGRRGGADQYVVLSGGAGNPAMMSGVVDPSAGAGVPAAEGSIYCRYGAGAGQLWLKTGAADTAWTQLTGGDPFLGFFGDASDGDHTLVGLETLTEDKFYNDLDLDGNDLNANGYRLFVRGTLTIPSGSAIYHVGDPAVAAAAGDGAESGQLGGGSNGGAGASGAGSAGSAISRSLSADGGAGGLGTGGAGGAGGNAVALGTEKIGPRTPPVIFTGMTYGWDTGTVQEINGGTGGGGGGGDGDNSGGGGGGGGGVVLISARNIVIEATGSIQANGGNGAAGTAADCGGGGGGSGGLIIVVYESLVNAGSISVAGGAGGASGGGTGVAGTAGGDGVIIDYPVV